jgi:hypothetical protein
MATSYGAIRPTLYRDFAANKTLNHGIGPDITFTRGSHATYFDANGKLQYASNNALPNSEGIGFVAGSPGTSPSNWSFNTSPSLGLTRTIATGKINGYNYVDITWTGVANAAGSLAQDASPLTTIIADIGQLWTFSSYVSLTINSGVAPAGFIRVTERTSAGALLNGTLAAFSSSNLTRISATRALNQTTVARISSDIRADNIVSGNLYNFTIRISQPQLEIGVSSPTEYKPTTGTAYYGPRFDSDLSTLRKTTNYILYSNDFSRSYWEGYYLKPAIQKTETDPFGNPSEAWKFLVSGCTGQAASLSYGGYKLPDRGLTGLITYNTQVVSSIWARCDSTTVANTLSIILSVADGQTSTNVRSSISTGWQRFSVTGTYISGINGLANYSRGLQFVAQRSLPMTDSGCAIYLYGAQTEMSPYLTDYVPTTGIPATVVQQQAASKGWLIEQARTNLLTYSQDISNPVWGKFVTGYTITTGVAPDGGTSQILTNTDVSTLYLYRPGDAGYANPSGTVYTLSCYIKSDSNRFSNAGISQGSFGTTNKDYIGNGWYRHWFTGITSTGTGIVSPQIALSPNEYVEVWGFQTEVGYFPTSYIPTASSQVTRNTEYGEILGNNFSGFYNTKNNNSTWYMNLDFRGRPDVNNQFVTPLTYTNNNNNGLFVFRQGNDFTGKIARTHDNFTGIVAAQQNQTYNTTYVQTGVVQARGSQSIYNNLPQGIRIGDGLSVGATVNGCVRQLIYYPSFSNDGRLIQITKP